MICESTVSFWKEKEMFQADFVIFFLAQIPQICTQIFLKTKKWRSIIPIKTKRYDY